MRPWLKSLGLVVLASCAGLEPVGELQVAPPPHLPELPAVPDPWRGAHWQRITGAPDGLLLCDLVSTPQGLVAAASLDVLSEDGAAILRLSPSPPLPLAGEAEARAARPGEGAWQTLLTWDGQGFIRVHYLGNHLVIPDADAPFHPLSFAFDLDVDGYVFVSDDQGRLSENHRAVLPRVYHVFDVTQLPDGRLLASTGAYPPDDVPYYSDRAPAALFVSAAPGEPWHRLLDYPSPDALGVHRFMYLHALPDGAVLVSFESSRLAATAWRIVGSGSQLEPVTGIDGVVLRWASWHDAVYAVVENIGGTELLLSTDAGRSFRPVPNAPLLPLSLAPSDEGLFLLAAGAVFSSTDGESFTQIVPPVEALAVIPSRRVSAPLVIHAGALWAASPLTGEVFAAIPAR